MQNRLKELRTARNWTLDRLADVTGLSKSFLSQIETGKRQPSMETLGILAGVFEIADAELLSDVLPLPVAVAPSGGDLVNVYAIQASAGHGAWVDEYEQVADRLSFPPGYLAKITKANPRDLVIIGVKGDSMIPTLNDDDVVMVDTSKRVLGYDGLFVLNYGGVLQVKRVGRSGRKDHVTVTSDNRALYPPFEAHMSEIEVIGKVVWMGVKV